MSETRQALSNEYLSGFGIEIGAGLCPTAGDKISGIIFIDKRSPDELAALFGRSPDYEILTAAQARGKFPHGVDFVAAHHVIEHCDNPIRVLVEEWLPLLREGGVLYL